MRNYCRCIGIKLVDFYLFFGKDFPRQRCDKTTLFCVFQWLFEYQKHRVFISDKRAGEKDI
jgi:hypothetical protein